MSAAKVVRAKKFGAKAAEKKAPPDARSVRRRDSIFAGPDGRVSDYSSR